MNIERKKRNQHEKYITFIYFSRKPLSNGLLCWKLMDAKGNTSLIQRNRRKNIYIGSYDQTLIKEGTFMSYLLLEVPFSKVFYGLRKACHWSIYNRKVLFVCHEKWSLCPTVSNHIWGEIFNVWEEIFTSGGRFPRLGGDFQRLGGDFQRLRGDFPIRAERRRRELRRWEHLIMYLPDCILAPRSR